MPYYAKTGRSRPLSLLPDFLDNFIVHNKCYTYFGMLAAYSYPRKLKKKNYCQDLERNKGK
jgi:hypothetical protein